MKPYSPIPRLSHDSLIRRLLRKDVDADVQRIDLITTTQLRLSIVDSGHHPMEKMAEGDTCIHVLWQAQENHAYIEIGGETFAIAPGDFAWIPMGDSWRLSPNQLAILIARRANSLAVPIEPIHGDDRFDGHNRETIARAPSGFRISRWKLTEPLALASSTHDVILVSLYADLAIRFDGGISMLNQGEASVIRPGTGQFTLVPNGLSYALVIQMDPDL